MKNDLFCFEELGFVLRFMQSMSVGKRVGEGEE